MRRVAQRHGKIGVAQEQEIAVWREVGQVACERSDELAYAARPGTEIATIECNPGADSAHISHFIQ
jgi:hypothetical protein